MTHTFFAKHGALAASIVVLVFAAFPLFALGQDFEGDNTPPNFTGNNTPPNFQGDNGLQNPLNVNSFPELLDKIFKVVMTIVIPLAVLFIVYAGLRLILARGNPEQLKTAKLHLWYTFFGIAIVLLAAVIIRVLINLACGVDIRGLEQCD